MPGTPILIYNTKKQIGRAGHGGDALQFPPADAVFEHVHALIRDAALLEKALGLLGVKAFSAINLISHLDSSVLFLIIEHDG